MNSDAPRVGILCEGFEGQATAPRSELILRDLRLGLR